MTDDDYQPVAVSRRLDALCSLAGKPAQPVVGAASRGWSWGPTPVD